MSEDLKKQIEKFKQGRLSIEESLKLLKDLEQELRNRIDKGEMVKPDSGSLVEKVLDAIEKYVGKLNLKVRRELPLQGFSGNWWKPDVVIEDTEIEDEEDRVKVIIECKEIDEGTSYQTYRYAHVPRAYTELSDLRNLEKPLKFVIFSRRLDKGRRGFDFDALFKSIGAEIIDWSDNYEWFFKFISKISPSLDTT